MKYTLLFFACFLAAQASAGPDRMLCSDSAHLDYSDFFLENNVWGKGDLKDWRQCVFGGTQAEEGFGWEWNWPEGPQDVAGFPEICFGYKPWGNASTTPALPARISDLKILRADQTLKMEAEGIYNLTFDLWLTREARPAEKNIAAEVMIWLDYKELIPDGRLVEKVELEGETYRFFKGQPPHASWPNLTFVKEKPRRNGETNLKAVLDYLVKNGHAGKDHYLASVEFGNEVHSGKGRTEVSHYEVTAESQ